MVARLALTVVLASVVGLVPGTGAASTARSTLVPAHGALLGAFVEPDNNWAGNATAIADVQAFEALIGRPIVVDNHYYGWTDVFPSGLEQWDLRHRMAPLVTWYGTNLEKIESGRLDALIARRAAGLRDLGRPVFLRWGWEMNGNWYPHSGAQNGGAAGVATFVRAWRHIHDVFDEVGARNVIWVWSPNFESVPNTRWNAAARYYPGDAYVDWVGVDAYNWGTSQTWSHWRSLARLIEPVYSTYAARKPIMVAETASAEAGGNKADWIRAAARELPSRFPDVKALLWFDDAKETDWRVNSSSTSLAAFRDLAHASYFTSAAFRRS